MLVRVLRCLPPRAARLHVAHLATTINTGGVENPTAYCKSLVQKHDYESYLCSYFYPRLSQPGYFALKAFFVSASPIVCY